MGFERFVDDLRRLSPGTEGSCLSACCALSLDALFGQDALEAQAALLAGFAEMPGGTTFANARVLLRRLFAVRADVVSGGPWAAGLLDRVPTGPLETVTFVDPARPTSPKQATRFSVLAAAFDRAGREALLVEALAA